MTTKNKAAIAWRAWALQLIDHYQERLEKDYPPKRMDTTKVVDQADGTGTNALCHAHWMLEKMPQLVMDGAQDKYNRWLGFVQGVFASFGIYSIDDMRGHNRK